MKKDLKKQMKEWRQHFHQNPETAFEEVKTAAFVADYLRGLGLDVHTGIGKTGVVANLKIGDGERVVGLRADMDAINMQETTGLPYASTVPNKMHACGHDGHTATLMGAATLLAEEKGFNGTVRFLFQPAEEPGKGAQAMVDDGLFERFPMDEIYGIHNASEIPEGTFHTRVGGIMASEDNFTIRIKGRGSHASAPHLSIDPLVTAAEIIMALQTIVSRNVSPIDQAVVSCTELYMDGVHNAIPSNVEILGDTRSNKEEIQALIEQRMQAICENICSANNADLDFLYTHEFAPTINWAEGVEKAVAVAKKVVGEENVNANCDPWMGSEDFGIFLKHVPGCFLFLGAGKSEERSKNTPLHNSKYDFNDDILMTGATFFQELIRHTLPL
jgi:amidohydrolase